MFHLGLSDVLSTDSELQISVLGKAWTLWNMEFQRFDAIFGISVGEFGGSASGDFGVNCANEFDVVSLMYR